MPYCKHCGNEIPQDALYCPKCGTPVLAAKDEHGSYPSREIGLATWGERFIAWLIDVIIIGVIVGFLGLFSWFAAGQLTWWSAWPSWIPFFNFNPSGVVLFLYWLLMDGFYGQSFGKMVMRIKVVRANGGRINMSQSALESLGKAFILPIDAIVGWILYPSRRQRLFNHLSETVVIKET
jgi:uncharacterized RDD family membrane protein YckC